MNQIKNIVNPNRMPLSLFYPGPCYDIISPLKDTDASEYIFVDHMDTCYSVDGIIMKIREIIEKIGGNVINIKNNDKYTKKISFDYENKEREIIYYFYKNVLDFKPKELEQGYDIYFSKGTGPFNNYMYISEKISLMNQKGFFISYDCDLISHSIIHKHNKQHIPTKFNLSDLKLEKRKITKGIKEYRDIYIIQKVEHMPQDKLAEILKIPYLELLLKDLEGIIATHEEYNRLLNNKRKGIIPTTDEKLCSLFATDSGWIKHLQRSIGELNIIYDSLPLEQIANYRRRIENTKERVLLFCNDSSTRELTFQ